MDEEDVNSITLADFTPMQASYVRHRTKGVCPTDAARLAGYACAEVVCSVLEHNPRIQIYLRNEQIRLLHNDGMRVAVKALIDIAGDPEAPKGVRVQAANSILNRVGITEKIAEKQSKIGDKPLSEMTIAELEAVIAEGREREGEHNADKDAIDVTPLTIAQDATPPHS